MILEIGKINVTGWLTSYSINKLPQKDSNEFITANGEVISDFKGYKISVSFALRRVPDDIARKISQTVSAETFSCTISSPCEMTEKFVISAYKAEPYEQGTKWHFDITIESAALTGSPGGCL